MKKLFALLFLAIIAFSHTANAQSFDGGILLMPQFTGLLNINDFAAGKDLDYTLTTGFAGGISGAYNFNNHTGVEINFIISSQGEKYKGNLNEFKGTGADTSSFVTFIAAQEGLPGYTSTQSDTAYTAKVSLTYLKIPVLFKLTSNSTKSAFFYLSVGPEFNILMSASHTLNGVVADYSTYNFTTKSLYKSSGIDAVLNIGAGFKLSSNLTLTAQINFDYGLTDSEDKSFEFSPTGSTKEVMPYSTSRKANNNGTAGLRLGLTYKFGEDK